MSKVKKRYVCRNCGTVSPVWLGKCPTCGQWNTFQEEIIYAENNKNIIDKKTKVKTPLLLSQISNKPIERFSSGFEEFDRILGGGFVPGTLILLSGEPGIGKSTLALQAALKANIKTLYVSGEESLEQIKLRSERIGLNSENTLFTTETTVEKIIPLIDEIKPSLAIIDSIQTLQTIRAESTPGSITQIRESTYLLQDIAKRKNTTFLIIGHITKDGSIAGPKILEHIVDTVLYFGGQKNYNFRMLRAVKNRFGATSELAIFQMHNNGLEEIKNPSEILLSGSSENISGVAIASAVEGINPLMVEVQALVNPAVYSAPQRIATGYDNKRLNMILAVIEKHLGVRLGIKDVFVNIAGGIKITDTALDLPVAMAILSSDTNAIIPRKFAFAGEISLAGEIKPVYRTEQRIAEAQKLGFEKIFISAFSKINEKNSKIQIVKIKHLKDILAIFN